jgi:hypothetical protein
LRFADRGLLCFAREVDSVRAVEPRTYFLTADASSTIVLRVEDYRESLLPDDDLIEVGLWSSEGQGFGLGVAFSVAELERLRDVLSEIIDRRD